MALALPSPGVRGRRNPFPLLVVAEETCHRGCEVLRRVRDHDGLARTRVDSLHSEPRRNNGLARAERFEHLDSHAASDADWCDDDGRVVEMLQDIGDHPCRRDTVLLEPSDLGGRFSANEDELCVTMCLPDAGKDLEGQPAGGICVRLMAEVADEEDRVRPPAERVERALVGGQNERDAGCSSLQSIGES
jgi:hypothetical protein